MLNDGRAASPRYQEQVPAVARAIAALDRLATSGGPCSLADLGRDLSISASSLLAILTTLRRAGLVARDGSGRYRAGPRLAALALAARQTDLYASFGYVAGRLVAALGETVLLWAGHEDRYILADAREGTHPLRFVPAPGLEWQGDEGLGEPHRPQLLEGELFAGVWSMAVPFPDPRAGCSALLAVVGPRERLARPAVRAELLMALAEAGPASHAIMTQIRLPSESAATRSVTGHRPARMSASPRTSAGPPGAGGGGTPWALAGPIDGPELDTFLSQSLVATLSYVGDDGFPATVPLWYAWDGTAFWLTSRPGSEWVDHVRLDPRVSLAVSESEPPLRRVLARGHVVEVGDPSGEHWAAVEDSLAARYAGFDAAREPAAAGRGRLLMLLPERLIAWRGLLRHPKLPPDPEQPDTAAWRHLG